MVDSFTNCNKVSFTALTGQLIATEVKQCQLHQLPNLGGNGTCQRISRTYRSVVDSYTKQTINLIIFAQHTAVVLSANSDLVISIPVSASRRWIVRTQVEFDASPTVVSVTR